MRFDQTINDYTLEGINSPPSSAQDALAEAAYLRLITPKGSYFADSELGSELYKLKRSKDVPRMRRQAIAWAKQALEPLRKPYYLNAIMVNARAGTQGYMQIESSLIRADGSQTTTSINVQVAG
jgi:phage gp46-like protein